MKWAHPQTEGVKRRGSRHEDEIAFDFEVKQSFFVHSPSAYRDPPNAIRSLTCLIPDDAPIWKENEKPNEED